MNCCSLSALSGEEVEQLMRAAASGNVQYISSCLSSSKEATCSTKDRFGQTAAHWAAYRGQLHILKMLIEAGASMETKDTDGRMTLHWAVRKERAACVHYLLQKGSPLDGQTKGTGETSLHKAARQGSLDIVTMLCIAGCRRDKCTSHNQTALDIAIEMRTLETEYAQKEKAEATEAAKQWSNENEEKDNEEKVDPGDQELTEEQKNRQLSYPADRPKESPYVATGEKEAEDENKFGPIVEFLEAFSEEMVAPDSLVMEEEDTVVKKKRGRGKLKRKSTIYQDDAPMAEVFEEQLRSGSMKSADASSSGGGCMIQ